MGAGDGNTPDDDGDLPGARPHLRAELPGSRPTARSEYAYQSIAPDSSVPSTDVPVDPYFTVPYNGGWRVQVGGNPTQDFMNTSQQIYNSVAAGVAPYTGVETDNTPTSGFDWATFTPGWQKSTYTFTATSSTMTVTFTSLAAATITAGAPALTSDETRLASLGLPTQYKSLITLLDDVTVTVVKWL